MMNIQTNSIFSRGRGFLACGAFLLCGTTFANATVAVQVYSREEAQSESNMSKPRIYVENTGDETLSGLRYTYYFTTENGQAPVLEKYYVPDADMSLRNLGNGMYAVEYSYAGSLRPGETTPNTSGSVIGLHYADWSVWNKNNDYSNNLDASFAPCAKIVVYYGGRRIYGTPPQGIVEDSSWVNVIGATAEHRIIKQVLQSSNEEVVVRYTTPGFQVAKITEDSSLYARLSIAGAATTNLVGSPQLPRIQELVAIPRGAQAVVDIVSDDYVDLAGYNVYPLQESPIDLAGAEDPPFTLDYGSYTSNGMYPSAIAQLSAVRKLRDLEHVQLDYSPLQYNPVTGTLRVYTSVTLRISFMDGDSAAADTVDPMTYRLASALALNADLVPEGTDQVSYTDHHLLIISAPGLVSAANRLAEWKRLQGLATRVITTSQTGTTTAAIQNFIQAVYDGTSNPKLETVLLFGDAEDIPTYLRSSTGTDYPYALLSGSDAVPDITLGRIPVDSLSEALNVVDKIISYEKNPPTDSGYYANLAFAAMFQGNNTTGAESRGYLETVENIILRLESLGYASDRIYASDVVNPTTFYSGAAVPSYLLSSRFTWDGGPDDITAAINAGRFLVVHRDHGFYNNWYLPNFTNGHVRALTNTGYPVVFSINCQTGWFDNEVNASSVSSADSLSFAEAFLRVGNTGAASVIAATRNSPTFDNNRLTNALFAALWPSSGTALSRLGEVLNAAKISVNSTSEYLLFHVLGDPTLRMWKSYPQEMTAYHNSTITTGDTLIPFVVSEAGAQIALVLNGELLRVVTTATAAETTMVHLPQPLQAYANIEIGVSKDGFRPYVSRISVLPAFPSVGSCGSTSAATGLAVATALTNHLAAISASDPVQSTTCTDLQSYDSALRGTAHDAVNPATLQHILEHFTGDGIINGSTVIDRSAVGGVYNWTYFQHADIDSMLYDIAYWQFTNGYGTPVPVKGDYSHWVSITSTTASFPFNSPADVEIKGFWIDDPSASSGVYKTFVPAQEWVDPVNLLYMPTLGNLYEAVIEPPSTRGRVSYYSQSGIDALSSDPVAAARKGVADYGLLQSAQFASAFEGAVAGYPLLVSRTDGGASFYMVPFSKADGRLAIIVRINARTGAFLGVAFSQETSLPYPIDPAKPPAVVPVLTWSAASETGPYSPAVQEAGQILISGTDPTMAVSRNVEVGPEGLEIVVANSGYLYGTMFTIRNLGISDTNQVEWYGVPEQNEGACANRSAILAGNGAQINSVATSTRTDGTMRFTIRSLDGNVHAVQFGISNWQNGPGCAEE